MQPYVSYIQACNILSKKKKNIRGVGHTNSKTNRALTQQRSDQTTIFICKSSHGKKHEELLFKIKKKLQVQTS